MLQRNAVKTGISQQARTVSGVVELDIMAHMMGTEALPVVQVVRQEVAAQMALHLHVVHNIIAA